QVVDVNSKIRLKYRGEWITTSPGRVLFNSILHPELRYINKQMGKKSLGSLIDAAYDRVGQEALVEMLDKIKELGYHWSTISGISFGLGDVIIPPQKKDIVEQALGKEEVLSSQFEMGVLTEDEYLRQKETLWSEASREAADAILANMDLSNPIRMMMESGARGSKSQVAQMAGIRGLMADPSGKIIDYPIVSNFREGLNMLEYFISTHGARKGLADTALRTAKSGYLTRRLVDVAQDLIITAEDCGTDKGVCIRPLLQDGKMIISLGERIIGRTNLRDIVSPETGEVIVPEGELIDSEKAWQIEKAGLEEVWVRSPLTCALQDGICRQCYGMDLSSREKVLPGETVGVVAAQSIGEPGTQLTMRTFHTGGVRITGEDITQGLPRIEQLFEVRRPKKVAFLSDRDGYISEIREMEGKRKVFISSSEEGVESRSSYNIPASQPLLVEEGQQVRKGQPLTDGHVDPQQLLEIEGLEAVQNYLVDNIQSVYLSQGVSVSNKHIEVILRKVAPVNRVRVIEEGDSSFVSMELAWLSDLEREVENIKAGNERFLLEAVKIMSGKKLLDVAGQGSLESALVFKGQELDERSVRQILRPGSGVSELTLEDEGDILRVIVGESSFRRTMSGLELTETAELTEEETIPSGTALSGSSLTQLTQGFPPRILVRDVAILEEMKGKTYLAEDVVVGDNKLLDADRVIDDHAASVIRENNVEAIRIWKSPETVTISDSVQKMLIDQYWARPLVQAIDSDGNSVTDIPQLIDGSVVRGLVEGELTAVEIDGEILSRDAILRKVLSDVAYGKVLLEPVINKTGEVVADAGSEVNTQVLEALLSADPDEMVLRPIFTQAETKRTLQRVTFVRRLREEPIWKPVIHGITKAALATDSFLSAASFQQTAQVLAGAAVRGDVDKLKGLKENVIIGHLIPAGTSFEMYKDIRVKETPSSVEEPPREEVILNP
ncbi:MAG: DNA-directed RNA polymerase subunit beta', partial [Synergistales bacterium]|nr:DNA-directed RNA polymerase subunit beta' [Synergistales bacterium]